MNPGKLTCSRIWGLASMLHRRQNHPWVTCWTRSHLAVMLALQGAMFVNTVVLGRWMDEGNRPVTVWSPSHETIQALGHAEILLLRWYVEMQTFPVLSASQDFYHRCWKRKHFLMYIYIHIYILMEWREKWRMWGGKSTTILGISGSQKGTIIFFLTFAIKTSELAQLTVQSLWWRVRGHHS